MKKYKQQRMLIIIALLVFIVSILGGTMLALFAQPSSARTESTRPIERSEGSDTEGTAAPVKTEWGSTVVQDGTVWKYNRKLKTILFMGVDNAPSHLKSELNANGGRADTILLFVLNDEDKSIQVIEISRETMADVDVYDQYRNFLYSGEMQLTLQYSVGDSPARSCQLMKRKVSEILNNVRIDNHIALTMDGIGDIVDAMGGIPLTLEDDWTQLDPSYTKGSTITLDKYNAEGFVRYRDLNSTGSNDARMERHNWLLHQVFQQLTQCSSSKIDSILESAGKYIEMDIDVATIKKLRDYQVLPTFLKLPGETVAGAEHDEYWLDYTALEQMILEQFYIRES